MRTDGVGIGVAPGSSQGEQGNGKLATLATPGTAATMRSRADVTDADLVEAVRVGDDHAFERLYHRYHRRIAAYIYGMVHDHGRAEDLTQDVFMSALRRMRETDRPIAFKPWIYEIAKNACIDAFRRSRRAEEVSYDAEDGLAPSDHGKLVHLGATPDVAVDRKMQLDHLRGAFGGLSEAHHQILVMRELEGLSYREIGERLGMTRPSVESTLFRARRRLTEEYEELVTGQRCLRVQAIITGAGDTALGARDQRRVARHISYCQPCRRQARLAGLDAAAMARRPVRAKIAAFLPLPAFLRRRWLVGGDDVATAAAPHGSSVAQWSTGMAQYADAASGGWMKAAAAATAVALAGVGAGTATTRVVGSHGSKAPQAAAHRATPPSAPGTGATSAASAARGAVAGTSRAGTRKHVPASVRTGATTPARRDAGSGAAPASSGASATPGAGSPAANLPAAGGGAADSTTSSASQTVTSTAGGSDPLSPVKTLVGGGSGPSAGGGTGTQAAKPVINPQPAQLAPDAAAPASAPPPSQPAGAGQVVQDTTSKVGGAVGGTAGDAAKNAGGAAGAVLGG